MKVSFIPSIKLLFSTWRNSLWAEWGLLALGIGLLWLSMPGIAPAWLGWIGGWTGLVPLFFAWRRNESVSQSFFQAIRWGTAYHLIYFQWFFSIHPLSWLGFETIQSAFIATAGWFLFALSQGVIIGLIWGISYWLVQRHPRWIFVSFPLLWWLGLWWLNQSPIGAPWGFLAYSQVSVPWIRQSVFGLSFYGLEVMMALANVCLYTLLYSALLPEHRFVNRQNTLAASALLGFVITVIALIPWLVKPKPSSFFDTLRPAIIQANLTLDDEHQLLSSKDKTLIYQSLSEPLTRNHLLLIWPEGILIPNTQAQTQQWVNHHEQILLSGATTWTEDDIFNSIVLLLPHSPSQVIHKRKLVAFGEITPFISPQWLSKALALFDIDYIANFKAGSMDQEPLRVNNQKIGVFICFEALYPNLSLKARRQHVDGLLTVSNLGWFHENPLLARQFLAFNQFRAAEAGVPLILAVNNGPSAYIDETGQVQMQSPIGLSTTLLYPH